MPQKDSTFRIAVLVNTTLRASSQPSTRDSFTTTILEVAPDAELHFYDPIHAQEYPDAEKYDLIILSGGVADINAPEPWVLKMLDFIRTTVASSRIKLLGICWGHQAINVALGGKLAMMEEDPELGVKTVRLTKRGVIFFDFAADESQLNIHEFHRRKIVEPAPEFVPLAEDHQSFLSPDNRILTFQGHPEMDAKLAQAILRDAPAYTEKMTTDQLTEVSKTMEEKHDGKAIFDRVLRWIQE